MYLNWVRWFGEPALYPLSQAGWLAYNTLSFNLRAVVGDLASGTIRCLGDKVDSTGEFQDFVCMSWKKDVFVRFRKQ